MPVLGQKGKTFGNYIFHFVTGTSQTWTAPYSGLIEVFVTGGGGSGARAPTTDGSEATKATGGGAGGLSTKTIEVSLGDTYTITCGAGAISLATDRTLAQGSAGGASRFVTASGTTIDLNAGGGGGGVGGYTSNSALAGGTGGSASGGTYNRVGGAGGAITGTQGTSGIATGGGAVAWHGVGGNSAGYAGGGANNVDTSNCRYATGGGGTGGRGGNFTDSSTAPNATPGGGTFGNGADSDGSADYPFLKPPNNGGFSSPSNIGPSDGGNAYYGFNYQGQSSVANLPSGAFMTDLFNFTSSSLPAGGNGAQGGSGFSPFGTGGSGNCTAGANSMGCAGGVFGGGGGYVQNATADMSVNNVKGNGGFGGGGGGGVSNRANGKQINSGGGPGCCIILYLALT